MLLSFVNSTTLTSFDEALASSLTGAREKASVEAADVAVLPELGSCTTASTLKDTTPL